MNLPNALTASRIFLVPILVAVLLTGTTPNREIVGLGVFIAASVTDFLDGYLARKRKQVTSLGILMDPIADKLLISAAFISLVQNGAVPAWVVVIIVGREFAVTGLRSVAAVHGSAIMASRLGKYKMVSQVVCVSYLIGKRLIRPGYSADDPVGILVNRYIDWTGYLLLTVVVLLALLSMVQYFRRYWNTIDQPITPA